MDADQLTVKLLNLANEVDDTLAWAKSKQLPAAVKARLRRIRGQVTQIALAVQAEPPTWTERARAWLTSAWEKIGGRCQ